MIDRDAVWAQWEEKFAVEIKWYQKLDKVDDQLGVNVPCELTLGAGEVDPDKFSRELHQETLDHTKQYNCFPLTLHNNESTHFKDFEKLRIEKEGKNNKTD